MQIINDTCYQTHDLRRYIVRCLKNERKAEKKYLRVTFKHRRNHEHGRRKDTSCSGWAYLGGQIMQVTIPRPDKLDRVDLAHTIAHELGHIAGLTHADMGGIVNGCAYYMRVGNWRDRFAWANDIPLREVQPKARYVPTATDKREHADRMVKAWETKIKRAETMLKKWKRRAKRIDRTISIQPATPASHPCTSTAPLSA